MPSDDIDVGVICMEDSLWNKIMTRGRSEGKKRATPAQIEHIVSSFEDSCQGWRIQVHRDLGTYPLFDALAMWVRESGYLLENGFIGQTSYEKVQELGKKYVDGEL